jgi:hypothetical protein
VAIGRHDARAGRQYRLLGHSVRSPTAVERCLVTLLIRQLSVIVYAREGAD